MTRILVVAAIIERDDRFLITRRQDGVHLAGFWEFPGGKVADGESHTAALCREIHEELDVEIVVRDLVLETSHEYRERVVTLFFYRCELNGTPRPMIGQEMAWVPRGELPSLSFPPADDELIRRLTDRRGGP